MIFDGKLYSYILYVKLSLSLKHCYYNRSPSTMVKSYIISSIHKHVIAKRYHNMAKQNKTHQYERQACRAIKHRRTRPALVEMEHLYKGHFA